MNIACTPAEYKALTLILNHENIRYTTGVGPGCIAVTIDKKEEKRLKISIKEWISAINGIQQQIKL